MECLASLSQTIMPCLLSALRKRLSTSRISSPRQVMRPSLVRNCSRGFRILGRILDFRQPKVSPKRNLFPLLTSLFKFLLIRLLPNLCTLFLKPVRDCVRFFPPNKTTLGPRRRIGSSLLMCLTNYIFMVWRKRMLLQIGITTLSLVVSLMDILLCLRLLWEPWRGNYLNCLRHSRHHAEKNGTL